MHCRFIPVVLGAATALSACRATPSPPAASATSGSNPARSSPPAVVIGPAPARAPASGAVPARFDEMRGEFLDAWPQIARRLADPPEVDALVEPSVGLYVLDNPGAVVVVTHYESYSAAFAGGPLVPVLRECPLRSGPLPEYSCATETYEVAGCILTAGVGAHLAETAQWSLPPADEVPEVERDLAALREVDAAVRQVVTDTRTDTRWYFGKLHGRWWLIAVDVVVPCSA